MVTRKIIDIDAEKCTGCGECIPDCPEGAIQLIDGKARLVSDLFCDGLGACIGSCPQDAIEIIEREAEPYNEKKVMERIVKQGENVIKAHLEHLKEHGEMRYLKQSEEFLEENNIKNPVGKLPCACPASNASHLKKQWPVQLTLVPVNAPYFDGSLLVSADCVAFAKRDFHDLLKGKSLVIGCPKLDNIEHYRKKLTEIIKENEIENITVAIMEVPCCQGLYSVVQEAIKESGKDIELRKEVIEIGG